MSQAGNWQDLATRDFDGIDPEGMVALLPVAAIENWSTILRPCPICAARRRLGPPASCRPRREAPPSISQ